MQYAVFNGDGVPSWIGPEPREGAEPVDLPVEFLAAHRRTKSGNWVERDPIEPAPPTADELAWLAEMQAAQEEAQRKILGVEFEGVLCSATAQDQSGLMAVLLAIQLQGPEFQPTRFEFENGNSLVIDLKNYQAFIATWMPFRQSFFKP